MNATSNHNPTDDSVDSTTSTTTTSHCTDDNNDNNHNDNHDRKRQRKQRDKDETSEEDEEDNTTDEAAMDVDDDDDDDDEGRQSSHRLPLAPCLEDFMAPGGTKRYRPRPEWYCGFAELQSFRTFRQQQQQQQQAQAQRHRHNHHQRRRRRHNNPLHEEEPENRAHPHPHPHVPNNHNNHNNHALRDLRNEDEDEDEDGAAPLDNARQQLPPEFAANAARQDQGMILVENQRAARIPPSAVVNQDDTIGEDENQRRNNSNESSRETGRGSLHGGDVDHDGDNDDGDNDELEETRNRFKRKSQRIRGNNENDNDCLPPPPCSYGKEFDPALHMTIRCDATEAALSLMSYGAPVNAGNVKGVTPLILASQIGNFVLVKELLRRGALPSTSSSNGATPVLQAAHNGHVNVVDALIQAGGTRLMEMANFNQTTPLMRAAQEGHVHVVRYLLKHGAMPNRRNGVQMTALMLAAQRGHAEVAQLLIDYGADLDALTAQESTSLLLACKRSHVDVVQVLVRSGCELFVRDSLGRTAREIAQRHDQNAKLEAMLDPLAQVHMMRNEARRQRTMALVRMWTLLQQGRANIAADQGEFKTIHDLAPMLQRYDLPYDLSQSTTLALFRVMTLPPALLQMVAEFAPCPLIWDKRVGLLTKRCLVNADAAVSCGLDLVDEILEEGGFLEACDLAKIPPPTNHESWKDWKRWCRCNSRGIGMRPQARVRPNATLAMVPGPVDPSRPSLVELRREVGYLKLLTSNQTLTKILASPPYKIPSLIIKQLSNVADIQSLVRRMNSRGVHVDPPVAMDIIMLTSRLCSWYSRERENPVSNYCG